MNRDDIGTPEGMLYRVLVKARHGGWFFRVDEDAYIEVPQWMWPSCERANPDPVCIGDEE